MPYADAGKDVPVTVAEARVLELKTGASEQRIAAALVAAPCRFPACLGLGVIACRGRGGRRRTGEPQLGRQEGQDVAELGRVVVDAQVHGPGNCVHGAQVDDGSSRVVAVDAVGVARLRGDHRCSAAHLVDQPGPARTVDAAEPQHTGVMPVPRRRL